MATKLESLDEDMLLTLSEKLRTWDANFRVITDMIAKMNELQNDVRELKTKGEPQSPASPPAICRAARISVRTVLRYRLIRRNIFLRRDQESVT